MEDLKRFSSTAREVRKLTSRTQLTAFKREFYNWIELAQFEKMNKMRIFFNLLANIDACIMHAKAKKIFTDPLPKMLHVHGAIMPSSAERDPLIILLAEMISAFNGLIRNYPEIKRQVEVNENLQRESETKEKRKSPRKSKGAHDKTSRAIEPKTPRIEEIPTQVETKTPRTEEVRAPQLVPKPEPENPQQPVAAKGHSRERSSSQVVPPASIRESFTSSHRGGRPGLFNRSAPATYHP